MGYHGLVLVRYCVRFASEYTIYLMRVHVGSTIGSDRCAEASGD